MNLLALNIDPKYLIIASIVSAVIIVVAIIIIIAVVHSSKKKKRVREKQVEPAVVAPPVSSSPSPNGNLKYYSRPLLTEFELDYYRAIHAATPQNFYLFPKVNLTSIIEIVPSSTKGLHRNIAFGIFDYLYRPIVLIDVYDDSHRAPEQIERDKKIKEICDAARIPLIILWKSTGIDKNDIRYRIYSEIQHKRDQTF